MERKFAKPNCEQFVKGFDTKTVHAGFYGDQYGSVVPPIILSSTFKEDFQSTFSYSRDGNPTRAVFEENIAALEGAKHAIAFSSGMAALTTLFHIMNPGDHFIISEHVYGGILQYLDEIATPKQALQYDFVDTSNIEEIKKAIKPNTKLVHIESPTNPFLNVLDIRAISEFCKSNKIILSIDNTFMGPALQQPLSLGVDIVVHSATKYIGGHSDLTMGVICVSDEVLYKSLLKFQQVTGNQASPFDCYLAWRGLKTLNIRMIAAEEGAHKVVEYLKTQPKIEKIYYPGLPTHPGHELMKKQAKGFGAMIAFHLKEEKAVQFCKELTIFARAASLGGVESLASYPVYYTHEHVNPKICEKLGVNYKLVRLSIGLETPEDLIADLNNAFSKI